MIPTIKRVVDPKTGKVIGDFMNPLKDAIKPFWLRGDTYPLALGSLATRRLQFTVPAEENLKGDMESFHLLSEHDSPFTVRLLHEGLNKYLTSEPIHSANIFGNAQLPARLYESLFLETNQTLIVECVNLSQSTNNIRMTLEGRRFLNYELPGMSREMIIREFYGRKTHPYWLTLDTPVTLDANGTADVRMTLTGEADMDVAFILDNGADGPYTIELLEGRSGRSLMAEGEIHINSVGGSAGLPFYLVDSWLVKRQTALRVRMTDLSGASNRVFPTLHGSLVYYSEYGREDLHTLDPMIAPRRMGTRAAGGMPFPPELAQTMRGYWR